MTDKISLYYTAGSPPSRACINLARILNVEVELKNVNMLKGELQTEWFKQLNPVKKIPVMVYNGFILAESRAILAYIVNKWKPGSSWYPNNPEQRALIDQRMYFDATIVFPSLGGVVVSIFRILSVEYCCSILLQRSILYNIGDKEAVKKEVLSSLRLLESFLSKSEFFAGDTLTIADISILANITTFDVR